MKLTLAEIKASRVPAALGYCSTDARVVQFVNEAVQRLITRGLWWGTVQRIKVCLSNACVTWPRHIAAIEALNICDWPIVGRNQWYEHLENGPGTQDETSYLQWIDRGRAATFDDITGTNKKIKVYADVDESASARILLQGHDENNNWIRTQDAGTWIDGEYVGINKTTPQTSTKFFTTLVSVQKPVTNGVVRVYELNTTTSALKALGYYEPDEKLPDYRRTIIAGLENVGDCCEGTGCASKTVIAMVKLEFIPMVVDLNWCMIGNIASLKDACVAIQRLEQNRPQEYEYFMASAELELNKELNHYQGDGPVVPARFAPREIWGGGGVANVI